MMCSIPYRALLCLAGILGVFLLVSGGTIAAQVAPQFSRAPGFHASAFDLELVSTTPGAIIRYTLDGSVPDEASPIYDGAIRIDDGNNRPAEISLIPTAWAPLWFPPPAIAEFRATVVRTRAYTAEGASPVTTGTFFVDETGRHFSLPVISLATDAGNFFDYDTGIYVAGRIFDENFDEDRFYGNHPANYNQRGVEWERPIHFEFFEAGGGLAIRQDLGVRTHGGATRAHHLKALRLYARSEYGPSTLVYPFFGDDNATEHKRLLLRGSGNDVYQTMLRDAYVHSLVTHLNFETQAYRPATVFLNGEYWGIQNIRQRYDDHYLSLEYGLPREGLAILSTNATIETGSVSDSLSWLALRSFLNTSNLEAPETRARVETEIDVGSHIDYHVAQIFACNIDWPGNNVRFWRASGHDSAFGPADGRWRWMLFDTDLSTANEDLSRAECNQLAVAAQYSSIFPRLLAMSWYRDAFVNRFADQLNSAFLTHRTVAQLDAMQQGIAFEMDRHLRRWGVPRDVDAWNAFVDDIRQFVISRPSIIWDQLVEHFDLGGHVALTVDVTDEAMGRIDVNSLIIDRSLLGITGAPYPWTGTYFEGIPVRVRARALPGYRFVRWEGIDEDRAHDRELTLSLTTDVALAARFEIDDADPLHPFAHPVADRPYVFDHWDADEPEESFPASMVFQQSDMNDPGLGDEMTRPYLIPVEDYADADLGVLGFPYNTTARTRINGLGANGIAMINTGRGRDLGAAVLALNTLGVDHATVTWTGGTIIPNSRVYAIRLQYRVGEEGTFRDVIHGGEPVEYTRRSEAGHYEVIGPVWLPPNAMDRPYVQLRWKYYFTGERLDATSGQRDMLRIDDIIVAAAEAPTGAVALGFNQLHPTGQVGRPLIPFEVSATRTDGSVDVNYSGTVTLSLADDEDEGVLRGSTSRSFSRGIARFDDIVIDGTIAPIMLRARSAPLSEVVGPPLHLLRVSERVMPRFIQGDRSENLNRVPFAFLLEIDGMIPEREYRYGNRVVSLSDPADQNGAGNALYQLKNGSFVRNTNAPRFRDSDRHDRHGTFTTDADGRYTGWFFTEPTGNARLSPGDHVFMRILLNDGSGGEDYHHYVTSATPVRVTAFGEEEHHGSAVMGIGSAGAGHVAVIYDAERGGNVIAATPIEPTGLTLDDRFAQFYLDNISGSAGRFGALVPNHLPSGTRRIELRRLADGAIARSDISEDGRWDDTDTVDPRNGVSTALTIMLEASPGPVLLEPLHDAAEVVRGPHLVWSALGGQVYDIEIATDDRFEANLVQFTAITDTVLAPGSLGTDLQYFWRVRGSQPRTAWSAVHAFTTGWETSVTPSSGGQSLHIWNYPNPVKSQTTIAFILDEPAIVRIEVFDVLGRSIRVLTDERRPPGRHEVAFGARDIPSGVYFYRITADRQHQTGSMMIIR